MAVQRLDWIISGDAVSAADDGGAEGGDAAVWGGAGGEGWVGWDGVVDGFGLEGW